ncbi:MAG: hypothetical protein AB1611_01080 [bacterium]
MRKASTTGRVGLLFCPPPNTACDLIANPNWSSNSPVVRSAFIFILLWLLTISNEIGISREYWEYIGEKYQEREG